MNTAGNLARRGSDFPACKLIYCVLPDDGTDKRLLVELRKKHHIIRAGSVICRSVGALAAAKTKRGKLPEADLVRRLYVVCSEDEADDVFDLIFWSAQIDEPGRGAMWQQAIIASTPYELPPDVPDEETGA